MHRSAALIIIIYSTTKLKAFMPVPKKSLELTKQNKTLNGLGSSYPNSLLGAACSSQAYNFRVDRPIRKNPKSKKEKSQGRAKSDSHIEFMFRRSTLRRLIVFSGRYFILLITYVIFSLLTAIYRVKTPSFAGKLVDAVVVTKAEDRINLLIYRFLKSVFLSILFHFLSSLSQYFLRERIYLKLKRLAYESFVNKDTEYMEGKGATKILATLDKDISLVSKQATFITFVEIIKEIYTNTNQLVQLFEISFGMTMCLLITVPLFSVVIGRYSKYIKKSTIKIDKNAKACSELFTQTASNFNLIKSNSQELEFMRRFDNILEKSQRLSTTRSLLDASLKVFNSLIQRLGEVIILMYGANLLLNDGITPGNFSTFVMNSGAFHGITKIFSEHLNSVSKAGISCQRFFEFIDYKVKVQWNTGKVMDKIEGEISFENVTFAYPTRPDVPVIKNTSFEIKSKGSLGIVGPSGSGKSSFMKLIARVFDPTKGAVKIDGVNLNELNLKWFHEQVGYVNPDSVLFSGTLEENIAFGVKNYTHEDIMRCLKLANAKDIIKGFSSGLETRIGEKGMKLSSGQRQKILIARALLRKPKILIFDEATAMLDPKSEYQIQMTINKLIEEKQCTVVIIGNKLSAVRKCDMILAIKNGEIVERGTHKELINARGFYKKMYDNQLRAQNSHPNDN